jgi:hypothetical protein
MTPAYQTAKLSDIPPLENDYTHGTDWKPIRHHFGIQAFGVNAYVARGAGATVIDEHTEVEDSGTGHEELYLVASGHATFTVNGEKIDAPAGTLVFVRDPALKRSAVARDAGTAVVAVGAEPGTAFTPSDWELRYTVANA